MKKIIANFCVAIDFILFLIVFVVIITRLCDVSLHLNRNKEWYIQLISQQESDKDTLNMIWNNIIYYKSCVTRYSIYTSLGVLGLSSLSFLFVYCNPKLFRRSTWVNLSDEWAKNKEERAAARAAKADADKQKRIAELQAELDELKKDE